MLNLLVSSDQTGFVPGRHISSNIRKVLDVMDYTVRKNLAAVLISIYFEKAFDRVDYSSLYSSLQLFGIGTRFIEYTRVLFTDFELCTMNGGHRSDWWSPSRGLFQGNPSAPYYFILFIEILAIMLRTNNNIKGVSVNGIRALLSQFADDMDLFIEFRQETWQAVISCLTDYESISGMKINYEKTSVYRLGSIRLSNARFYSSQKIHWSDGPVNILRIHVSYDHDEMRNANLDPLLVKARRALSPWYLRGLNIIGKIEILNSLVASLFAYRMAVLPQISEEYFQKIHNIFLDFFVGRQEAKNPDEDTVWPKGRWRIGSN